jgi:hypothetical protein
MLNFISMLVVEVESYPIISCERGDRHAAIHPNLDRPGSQPGVVSRLPCTNDDACKQNRQRQLKLEGLAGKIQDRHPAKRLEALTETSKSETRTYPEQPVNQIIP